MPNPSGSRDDSYYRRLDVQRDASHDDIVRAYRRMAMGAHPDARPGDPEAARRFREITEAYEVLGDPGRRAAYDHQTIGPGVHVHVHNVTPGTGAQIADHLTEPIVLGAPRHTLRDGVPLCVGPVRVEGDGARGLTGWEHWTWNLVDLWMIRSWWGR